MKNIFIKQTLEINAWIDFIVSMNIDQKYLTTSANFVEKAKQQNSRVQLAKFKGNLPHAHAFFYISRGNLVTQPNNKLEWDNKEYINENMINYM